jgi:hypothetical protein
LPENGQARIAGHLDRDAWQPRPQRSTVWLTACRSSQASKNASGTTSSARRLALPLTADWYDIDFPEVITARQQLLPDRANAHGVGTDLTDPSWLDAIPTGRPSVIVADGLMAFLTPEEMSFLLNRLISHFPSGEVAFNGYTRVPAGPSPVHPPGSTQHSLVPKRNHCPALPLLARQPTVVRQDALGLPAGSEELTPRPDDTFVPAAPRKIPPRAPFRVTARLGARS